jgi:hypothetical protein
MNNPLKLNCRYDTSFSPPRFQIFMEHAVDKGKKNVSFGTSLAQKDQLP